MRVEEEAALPLPFEGSLESLIDLAVLVRRLEALRYRFEGLAFLVPLSVMVAQQCKDHWLVMVVISF